MTHLDPFRLRLVTCIAQSLEQINPANGSAFDLTGAVFVGRDLFGDSDPVPMLAILEDLDSPPPLPSQRDNTAWVGPYNLLIQGFVEAAKDNRPLAPAYRLAAEMQKRLAAEKVRVNRLPGRGPTPNIFGMDGRVDSMSFSPAIVRPADGEISEKSYFWLRLSLGIVENLVDPYE